MMNLELKVNFFLKDKQIVSSSKIWRNVVNNDVRKRRAKQQIFLIAEWKFLKFRATLNKRIKKTKWNNISI